jgi:hypothetical protein
MLSVNNMITSGNLTAQPGGSRSELFIKAEQIQIEILASKEDKKALIGCEMK